MSDILQIISERHDAQAPTAVEVPEWGVTLYFTPLTAAERAAIRKGVNPDDDGEMLVSGLIRKARDKDGKPVFEDNATTRATLVGKAEFSVIRRIMNEASAASPVGTADDVKNA
ncbi:MAG: hypothetical protein VX874_15895 [Pseudomonadota bacterium]|nr:hypothetical protein [Pseudomonadota bacterium]